MPKLRSFQIDTVELGQDPDLQSGVAGAINLAGLGDTVITTPINSEVLTFDGTNWINQTHVAGVTDHTSLTNIGTNTHAQIDTHIADATIHFTQAAISITESQISDLQPYLLNISNESINALSDVNTTTVILGQVLTYAGSPPMWIATTPAPGVTDHTSLTNIGTNTHAQIDTHIAGTALQHPATDVLYSNTTSGLAATDVQSAIDENVVGIAGKMNWLNLWADGTYSANDTVRDGDWTMVANKTTTESAAPQPEGQPEILPDRATVWEVNNSFTGIVHMVHTYTTLQDGWLNELRVRVPFADVNTYSRITVTNTSTGEVTIYDDPILTSDGWTLLKAGNFIVASGVNFRIELEYYNSASSSTITGGWRSNENTGEPSTGNFNIDDVATPTVIEINYTDLDNTNRSTELDGVSVDSIINIAETGSTDRNIELKVTAVDTTSATSTKYNVDVIQNGSNDIRDGRTCTIKIDVPITQPSKFNYNTDYWVTNPPAFATVASELYFDGVLQPDVNDAYGIELTFQKAYVSPDWDVLAVSAASSGSNGSNIKYVDLTTGTGSPLGMTDTTLPLTWTTTYNSVGNFTITHNRNSTEVGFALSVLHATIPHVITPTAIAANSITFQVVDMAGTAQEANVVGKLLF